METNKKANQLMAVITALALVAGTSSLFLVGALEQPAAAERGGHGTPRTDPGQPPDPNCFGEINVGAAQIEDDQPGLGEHASDPIPGNDDNETPRLGVGNQVEDTPGEHAQTVGPIVLGPDPCEPGPSAQN
jgi:hypothetical protein